MKCEHYQRLISDDIDGALAGRDRRKLQSHLDSCSACRAYRIDLAHIQAESGLVKAGTVDPDYLERFAITIETKLRQEKQITGGTLLKWRWAWVFAPLALALVLGILLFRNGETASSMRFFPLRAVSTGSFRRSAGRMKSRRTSTASSPTRSSRGASWPFWRGISASGASRSSGGV